MDGDCILERIVCDDDCLSAAISSYVEALVRSVDSEFGTKAELFTPIVVRMDARQGPHFDATKRPGVYVFIHQDYGYLKIGKNHLNASKRALEHCRDNTSSKDETVKMADYSDSDKTYMLVFALQNDSLHWVLALEHYLENEFKPRIRSQRNG